MRNYIFTFLIVTTSMLSANPVTWANQEYKDFRTYPRINKAEVLLKNGEEEEAKRLLLKSLEIDSDNKKAKHLLAKICIQEKDEACIEKYSSQVSHIGLGYFYKTRAQEAKKNENYEDAIVFSKKALHHTLKNKDKKFIKLIMFESYLKLKQYDNADKLIETKQNIIYQLFKWAKISDNLDESKYAYSLAKQLPNKKEYLKFKIELLLKNREYEKASEELEVLNKIEPSDKNKKRLRYLYSITNQDDKILEEYHQKLEKGCDRYALKALLQNAKENEEKRGALLEKFYPYSCLTKREKVALSMELIEYLKTNNPTKVKTIVNALVPEMKSEKDLINLYETAKEKDEIVNLYKKRLNRHCDSYALYFLLDYYKKNRNKRRELLENAYPYSCVSKKKRAKLSFELINMLDVKKSKQISSILKTLNKNHLEKKSYLYLSNLESSLGHYEKSIEYAKEYLKIKPHTLEAIKNIGFSYFKLNKKNLAIHYLMKASKLAPNDVKLLKNIGFLCFDLERYKEVAYYWNIYLQKRDDPKIELELASIYFYKLKNHKKASSLIERYEKSTKKYSLRYYQLKAKLVYETKDCSKSLKYYSKLVEMDKSKDIRYEQIHLLQRCNQKREALRLMESFVNDYPKSTQYQKELAYMYYANKNYSNAIDNYKKVIEKEPDNRENYMSLAYSYKNIGEKQKSIDMFKKAIDRSRDMYRADRESIKREITSESKIFHLYLAQSLRLNSYRKKNGFSPVNSASYNGFGSMQITYQPTFLPKSTLLYANVIHGHKKVKETAQTSVGIKYKPLKDKEVYLSAEKLIKVGKGTRDDVLLRASLGISGKSKSNVHSSFYAESAFLAKNKNTILYANYEYGKKYKISKNMMVTPYITTGATYNNDNKFKKSVTKLDVGAGVAVDINSGETKYEIGKYKNKLKLEARQKYGGNSNDKQTLRLQWEFFY